MEAQVVQEQHAALVPNDLLELEQEGVEVFFLDTLGTHQGVDRLAECIDYRDHSNRIE